MPILRSAQLISNSPLILSAANRLLPVFGTANGSSDISTVINPVTSPPSTDNENPDFPASNMANPSTHLRWESGNTGNDVLINIGGVAYLTALNYVAFAVHNLAGYVVTIFGFTTNSPNDAITLFEATTIADNTPLIMEFIPGNYSGIQIKIVGSGIRSVAVLYTGELLRMERSVKVDVDLTPINRGLKADVFNGFSEAGHFVGRLVRNEIFESKIEFSNITRDFYIDDVNFWLVNYAPTRPFFIAWAPDDYSTEVGFCWLLDNPVPLQNPVTRRYSLTLNMRGFGAA